MQAVGALCMLVLPACARSSAEPRLWSVSASKNAGIGREGHLEPHSERSHSQWGCTHAGCAEAAAAAAEDENNDDAAGVLL